MTLDELRNEMANCRLSADQEAAAFKDQNIALQRLRAIYGEFGDSDRDIADQVIGEWALSEEEAVRFDALALIGELRIKTALPALHELARRLAVDRAASAPHELKKVHRTIAGLVAAAK